MEIGWSARRVARQLGRSDCVVRRCWDQWIREMLFTRSPGSRRPRQICHREDHHVIRNARVQPTASSAAIQAQVAPSLGAPLSSRIIRRSLAEGHLGSRRPLHVLPLTPSHRRLRLEWCCAQGNWTAAEWNQVVLCDESRFNLSSNDNRIRVWRPLLASHGARGRNIWPHTARVSQDCLHTVTTHPWPARSPDLSPIEHF
ncbi:transposable element Tcb2 transposase [Trichonephila clavipes]|nr:transposable element Tcb2 transposase [Trichonephila clavipes]